MLVVDHNHLPRDVRGKGHCLQGHVRSLGPESGTRLIVLNHAKYIKCVDTRGEIKNEGEVEADHEDKRATQGDALKAGHHGDSRKNVCVVLE